MNSMEGNATHTLDPVTMTTLPVKSGQSTGGRGVNWERRKDARVNFMMARLCVDDRWQVFQVG